MLKIIKDGNIFDSKCYCLVNPVNCVGVMGKGLAKEFKERYPIAYNLYLDYCKNGELKPGTLRCCKTIDRYIMFFPTKTHFKFPSSIEYIKSGLDYFVRNYKFLEPQMIRSFAFPMLGCGCGGLKKADVLSLMIEKLKDLDVYIEIYV